MGNYYDRDVEKRPRIQKLIDDLYDHMPEIEADRAVILTESYQETEEEPIVLRRAKAFQAICEKLHFASLEFQTIEGLCQAIGIEPCKLCTYCWTGKE